MKGAVLAGEDADRSHNVVGNSDALDRLHLADLLEQFVSDGLLSTGVRDAVGQTAFT